MYFVIFLFVYVCIFFFIFWNFYELWMINIFYYFIDIVNIGYLFINIYVVEYVYFRGIKYDRIFKIIEDSRVIVYYRGF